jgi:hypothetical protein
MLPPTPVLLLPPTPVLPLPPTPVLPLAIEVVVPLVLPALVELPTSVEAASSELPQAVPSETIRKAAPVFNRLDFIIIVAGRCIIRNRLS